MVPNKAHKTGLVGGIEELLWAEVCHHCLQRFMRIATACVEDTGGVDDIACMQHWDGGWIRECSYHTAKQGNDLENDRKSVLVPRATIGLRSEQPVNSTKRKKLTIQNVLLNVTFDCNISQIAKSTIKRAHTFKTLR